MAGSHMEVIHYPDDPRPLRWAQTVLALGNFDGLHRGHARIIEQVRRRADEHTLALVLGRALQLTNILRDLAEDAALGRLYLPRELLAAHGIETREPAAALAHPGLPGACAEIAAEARAGYTETRRLLAHCDRRRLRPSVAMMEVYERILDLLEARGWREPGRGVHVSSAEKLWIAVRLGLAW